MLCAETSAKSAMVYALPLPPPSTWWIAKRSLKALINPSNPPAGRSWAESSAFRTMMFAWAFNSLRQTFPPRPGSVTFVSTSASSSVITCASSARHRLALASSTCPYSDGTQTADFYALRALSSDHRLEGLRITGRRPRPDLSPLSAQVSATLGQMGMAQTFGAVRFSGTPKASPLKGASSVPPLSRTPDRSIPAVACSRLMSRDTWPLPLAPARFPRPPPV